MASALMDKMPLRRLESATFTAALDTIEMGGLTATVDPSPLVDAYMQSLAEPNYALTAIGISASLAATLLALVARLPLERRHAFLFPIDVKARLAAGSDDNPFTVADQIARSIRTHLRILCRAIAGSKDTPPADLVDATIATIESGALTHKEKGRISAFAPRLENQNILEASDRPIAADLGAALNALDAVARDRILAAILETDEPMVLAQLIAFAPHAMRAAIEKRVSELTPSKAGDIYSLTEAQARIEQLLAAGLASAAEQFTEEEVKLQTLGKPRGRILARLRTTLRLSFLRQNWAAIANITRPPDLPVGEEQAADDLILFFRALAEIKKSNGDVRGAEQALARLHHGRPDITAYGVNLFAARIRLLLGDNAFALLDGPALARPASCWPMPTP
jgi:hypothetical protein